MTKPNLHSQRLLNSRQRAVRGERIRRRVNNRNLNTHPAYTNKKEYPSDRGTLVMSSQFCVCGLALRRLMAMLRVPICKGAK